MGLAYRNIYTKPTTQDCIPGSLCAIPETNRIYRVLFWIVSLLVAMALIYPYLLPLFV
jgi:mercuric ion transport protein